MELCNDLVVRDFAERMKTAMGSGYMRIMVNHAVRTRNETYFKKVYVELQDKLPLENAKFCAMLYANDLLPGGNLETINEI